MSNTEKQTEKKKTSASPEKPETPQKGILRDYFESFVVTLLMAIFGMTFVVQAVTVPTGSMQNTIMIGDNLLVNKFIFAPGYKLPFLPQRDIVRGDIIVFKYPGPNDPPNSVQYQTSFVKRVVGLPGDTLEFRQNQVFINGDLLPEHRIVADSDDQVSALEIKQNPPRQSDEKYSVYYSSETTNTVEKSGILPFRGKFGVGKPITIPPDNYFAMGDSRDDSADSRFWGFVPRDVIIGRAMFVYYSYDRGAPGKGNPVSDFFMNSRWSRIGTMIK